jgi:hypothetical protein
MKKVLLTIFTAFALSNSFAQVIWSEDFEGAVPPAIPGTFTQATLATDGGWKSGTGTGLSSANFPIGDHSKIVATNDDGCNCNKSADVLKFPSINLAAYPANVYLQFDMVFAGGTYNNITETAEIQYSTNGGATWTTLSTIAGTNSLSWVTRAYALTPVLGQANVLLAIKYSDGGDWLFGLALDNIKVLVPPAKDINVYAAYPGGKYLVTNNVFQTGLTTFGMDPVTSVTLKYQVGAMAPVTKTFTLSPALNFTDSKVLSFDPAALTPGQHTNLKVWVTDINGGGADANNGNDTAVWNGSMYVATQTTARNVLIEEFTSSTCPPCAALNVSFDPLLEANAPNTGSTFNVVKYQMNWPSPGNDPSYNSDGSTRRGFYGVNGIPAVVMNGTSSMPSKTQGAIDTAKTIPAFSTMTATLTRTGTTYNGSVSFTPYVTISAGSNLFLYQAYSQKFYNYPGASTSQKDYHHAMRKMMPNGSGKYVSSTVAGTAMNESSSYTFNTVGTPAQNSYDLWVTNAGTVEYVAFLQDTTTGEILQSASNNVSVSIVDLEDNQSIGMYPNPATDFTTVAVKVNNATKVSMMVVDMNGRVIYKKEEADVKAGQNEIAINTSTWANGTYSVIVKTPLGDLKQALTVKH